MYLRMYLADYLIEEIPVFPNLLPGAEHREMYVKAIVNDLKKKHQDLVSKFGIAPVFFLEEVPSKMNTMLDIDLDYLFADMVIDSAMKN